MNSQSPTSVPEWIVAEDFFSLKVNRRRLLRATAVVTVSEAVLSLAYLVYLGAVRLPFHLGDLSTIESLTAVAGFWLSGITILVLALRSTRSPENYWRRLRTYALASLAGPVFFLLVATACDDVLSDLYNWHRGLLFRWSDEFGWEWARDPLEVSVDYVSIGAVVSLGMAAGVFIAWRRRRKAEDRLMQHNGST